VNRSISLLGMNRRLGSLAGRFLTNLNESLASGIVLRFHKRVFLGKLGQLLKFGFLELGVDTLLLQLLIILFLLQLFNLLLYLLVGVGIVKNLVPSSDRSALGDLLHLNSGCSSL